MPKVLKHDVVKMKDIIIDPNLRKGEWEKGVDSLIKSIEKYGLIAPVTVLPFGDKYKLICGYRRYTALRSLKQTEIPAVVLDPKDEPNTLFLRIIENIEREQLNPMDEAHAYKLLVDNGTRAKDIAASVSRTEGYVSQRLSLLKLPECVQVAVEAGTITPTHAREIGRVLDPKQQEKLLDKAQKLGIGEFRQLVDKKLGKDTEDIEKRAAKGELDNADDGTKITAPVDDDAPKGKKGDEESVSLSPKGTPVLDRTFETFGLRSKDEVIHAIDRVKKLFFAAKEKKNVEREAYMKGVLTGIGWASRMPNVNIPLSEEDEPEKG